MKWRLPRSHGGRVRAGMADSERETLLAPGVASTGWWRAFTSLRQRNFRLFWSGQIISLLGTIMQGVGQTWLVLQLTHSAWQIGLVGALQAVPILFFSLFGGVFADRWPKRRILLLTQSAAMLQALLLWLLIASGSLQLWQLYVLVLLLGCTYSLGKPASRSFVIEMVGREELPNAFALSSSFTSLARIVGPALGGLIIATSNVTILFLLNALSFIPVLISLALIRSHELHGQQMRHGGEQQKTWQSLREGFAYVGRTPEVFLLIVVVGLVLLFGSNFGVVLPLFASDLLHVGATGFGLLSAAAAVGALLAALWLAWSNQQPTPRSVLLGMLIFASLEIVFAFSSSYLLSLLLIASIGFSEELFAMQALTALQRTTPAHLNGRVTSVQVLFFDGSLPLGYLLMGWLSASFGAPHAMLIGALLSLLIAAAAWLWWRNRNGWLVGGGS